MLRLVVVLALLLPASASAKFVFFQTPSHNIGCAYSSSAASLRCDIRTGLKPPPTKPKGCQNDWTFGYSVNATGRAHKVCAGDTVLSATARIIRYGRTWRGSAFSCKSSTSGLRCKILAATVSSSAEHIRIGSRLLAP